MVAYAELHCRSNFSFLAGASHPEQLAECAAQLGLGALALTDPDTGRVATAKQPRHWRRLLTCASAGVGDDVRVTLPDGRTVVALFAGYELPVSQPVEIAGSIEVLPNPLPDDLRDAIKAASPQVRLINTRVAEAIAQRYTLF